MPNTIKDSGFLEDSIEKKILLQVLSVSIIGILFYLLNSLFIQHNTTSIRDSSFALFIYSAMFVWVIFPGKFNIKKRTSTLLMALSVCSGFFVLGGYKGISAIDYLNMLFFISIMYQKKEKYSYLSILMAIVIASFSLQLFLPETIQNRSVNDPEWLFALNILIRLLLTLNLGIALKDAYSKEHTKTLDLINEINELNSEILTQNEELKSIQEELKTSNDQLELSVQERTQKLEIQNETLMMYAYLNSHIFRGPICRIQGILNLLEIEKDENHKAQLSTYLKQEVDSVDKIIKDISKILYDNNEELIQELKIKAQRLHKQQ